MALPGFLRRRPYLLNSVNVDVAALPATVELKPSAVAAGALILFSLVWMALSLDAVWPVASSSEAPLPILLIFLAFPLFGVVTGGIGVAMLTGRLTARLAPDGVAVEERGPLGTRRWTAAYAEFEGVRLIERRQRRRKGRDILWQIVELSHPDPGRSLPLVVRRGDDPPRAEWEAAARALGVPALVDGPDGPQARDPDALDLTLKDRAARGEAVSAWSAEGPAPPGLAVAREDGPQGPRLVVTLLRPRLPLWAVGLITLFGLALFAAGLDDDDPLAGVVMPLVGLAVMAGGAVVALLDRRRPRRLVVTRTAVALEDRLPWIGRKGTTDRLAHADIEDVRVAHAYGRRGRALAIEGDRGRIHTGHHLRAEDLRWLRNFVAAAVAEA